MSRDDATWKDTRIYFFSEYYIQMSNHFGYFLYICIKQA